MPLSDLAPRHARFTPADVLRERLESACRAHPALARLEGIGASEAGRPLPGVTRGHGPRVVTLTTGAHADEPVGPETLAASPSESTATAKKETRAASAQRIRGRVVARECTAPPASSAAPVPSGSAAPAPTTGHPRALCEWRGGDLHSRPRGSEPLSPLMLRPRYQPPRLVSVDDVLDEVQSAIRDALDQALSRYVGRLEEATRPLRFDRPALPEKDAAVYLGLSARKLKELRREGKVPAARVEGRLTYYRRADLDRFMMGSD
jgi:excisionase family DNA binding protein